MRRGLATLAGLGLLAALSHFPWGKTERVALIRLSWRTTGEQVKVARVQDPNLPVHMRLPESQAFELKIRPYHLKVDLDGQPALEQALVAPGFRHDRPLSVFQEFQVAAGEHQLKILFQAQPLAGAAAPPASAPVEMHLACQAGQVYLLTMDEAGKWVCYFKRRNPARI